MTRPLLTDLLLFTARVATMIGDTVHLVILYPDDKVGKVSILVYDSEADAEAAKDEVEEERPGSRIVIETKVVK